MWISRKRFERIEERVKELEVLHDRGDWVALRPVDKRHPRIPETTRQIKEALEMLLPNEINRTMPPRLSWNALGGFSAHPGGGTDSVIAVVRAIVEHLGITIEKEPARGERLVVKKREPRKLKAK